DGPATMGRPGSPVDEGRRVPGHDERRDRNLADRVRGPLRRARRGDDLAVRPVRQGRPEGAGLRRRRRPEPRPGADLLGGGGVDDFGALQILWFTLIAVLWVGYFFLEGFDFGAGMLLRVVGRERIERRAVIHTIGPVWDGNEVWLIVAGGATFAAFPDWYATLFSGFYIPLFLVVAGLLLRPAALEFWGKDERPAWRNACEWGLIVGSALPAFLWGLVFANMVDGVPIDGRKEFTGSLADVFGPYALLGGLTAVLLCASH